MDEGQFLSLRVGKQPDLTIYYDHRPIPAYRGETVIAALLRQQRQVSFLNSTVRPEPVSV